MFVSPLRASLVAQTVKRLTTMQETWVQSLGQKIPWRRKWQPTPVFSPGESDGRRSLVGYCPRGRKESDTTDRLHFFRKHIKKQRYYFVNKGLLSQGYGFSSSHVRMWELDYKESWAPKKWCFWTVFWRRLLRVPWTARRSNQSILK